jgi:hypothetical protein
MREFPSPFTLRGKLQLVLQTSQNITYLLSFSFILFFIDCLIENFAAVYTFNHKILVKSYLIMFQISGSWLEL